MALAAIIATGTFQAFAGLPVAYLLLVLGARLPLHRIGSRNDLSYGLYIFAFPVQQTLQLLFPHRELPVGLFVVIAVGATLPLAAASWFCVESQAMKLKGIFPIAPNRWWWPRERLQIYGKARFRRRST